MTTGIIDKARTQGVEATVNTTETRSVSVSFEFNRLKSIRDNHSLLTALQVIKEGRLGLARSTKPDPGGELLERAILLSEYGAPVTYSLPHAEEAATPLFCSKEVSESPIESMLALGEDLARFINSLHADVNGMVEVYKSSSLHTVGNTNGLDATWESSQFEVSAGLNLVEGQNMVQIHDFQTGTGLGYDLEELKTGIKESFDLARKNVSVEPGVYDVVFTWNSFHNLISPIIQCLDGNAIVREFSPFAGKLGERLFSPLLSIVEDGARPNAVASRLYDRQGVPCRRTPLVSSGVLLEYLLDLETAAKLGRKPTGTGGLSGVQHNNIVIESGSVAKEDMIAGLQRGIIIDGTMGAWAGNPYAGQVTGNISLGYLVIDGRPVGRVKDCMFSVNVLRHLKDDLVALSKEAKCIGNMFSPYALVRNVSVSAKAG